jgi:hypothetical protein
MKKLLLSILFLIPLAAICQTNVSGGIYSNTTWTKANSPYIVTDDVILMQGFTLTIEPGTVVRFKSYKSLEIKGTLVAHGTALDSIIFTADTSSPAPNHWRSIKIKGSQDMRVDMSYIKLMYSQYGVEFQIGAASSFSNSQFKYNGTAFSGTSLNVQVDNCLFSENTFGGNVVYINFSNCTFKNNGTGLNTYYCTIDNCFFRNNETGLKGGGEKIRYCTFKGNTTGVDLNQATLISCTEITENIVGLIYVPYYKALESTNKICNNSSYNLKYSGSSNWDIKNICWCESDPAVIGAKIYDGMDNTSLGIVTFTPFVNCNTSTSMTTLCPSMPNSIFGSYKESGPGLYPNPANFFSTLTLNDEMLGAHITLYNAMGQMIADLGEAESSSVEIAVNALPQGVYFVRATKNAEVYSLKLLVTN